MTGGFGDFAIRMALPWLSGDGSDSIKCIIASKCCLPAEIFVYGG